MTKQNTDIEIFDSNTIWNKRSKPAIVNIDIDGRINFSTEAVRLLGLREGMKIAFMINNNDKGVVYFYQQATGIPLRNAQQCKTGVRLQVLCRGLPIRILKYFDYKGDQNKSFVLKKDTVKFNSCQMWMILKDNIHKPIQWRKRDNKIE